MQARITEVQELLRRANALDHGFDEWQDNPTQMARAATDYAQLKEDLSERMKAFNRLRFTGATPWFEAAYDAGIRHAHQAMTARSGSGPKSPKWHVAVQALQNELKYYLAKLVTGAPTRA